MKLEIGSIVVDLGDTQISIVQTSPYPLVATGESFGGNYIFNFMLPATNELKKVFKFYHRPQSRNDIVEIPFRLDADGILYEGTASVTEASDMEYEIFCPIATGDFIKLAKKVKLNEIDLGGDRILRASSQYVDANLTNPIDFVEVGSPNPYETVVHPEFSTIHLNEGNHLNANGTELLIDIPGSQITVKFTIMAQIIYGYFALRVYLNKEKVWEEVLSNNSVFEVFLSSIDPMEITWDLFVQNSDSINPGLFDLDGIIYKTSKIEVFGEAIAFDPNLRYPDMDFALFPVENPNVFEKWDDDFYAVDNTSIKVLYSQFFKVINYHKNGGFPVTLSGIFERINYTAGNLITPFPYIGYLVKRIAYHFNLRIVNNPFEDELKYVVLINHFFENEFLSNDAKLVTPKSGFDLKDHVPDMTIYDFLKNLCNLFGLGYEVNNDRNEITFSFLQNIMLDEAYEDISRLIVDRLQVASKEVKGAKLRLLTPSDDKYFSNVKDLAGLHLKGIVQSINELPNPGLLNDCYYVQLSQAYYAWKYNPDTYSFGWVMYTYDYIREKEIGIELKDISTELVPVMLKYGLFDDTVGSPLNRQWLIPASHQAGRFEGAPDMYQTEWRGMLCFYHGMFPSLPGGTYPFGSPDIKDIHGNMIPGLSLSLRLDGEHGLYEKKWRKYLEWRINARTVKVKILPDRKFLQNLNFRSKKIINGVQYLLVEYRGSLSKDGPGIAELTLLIL